VALLLFLSLLNIPSAGQAQIPRGVVVQSVVQDSNAQRAGLREGDVLLLWTRGKAQGGISLPFDIRAIAIEQSPRGQVTIEGLRAGEKHVWELKESSSFWEFDARPEMPEALLSAHRSALALADAGQAPEAAGEWRRAAAEVQRPDPAGLGCWFTYRAAEVLVKAKLWNEADAAYGEALQLSKQLPPAVEALLLQIWADESYRRSDWDKAEKYSQESFAENQKLGAESLMVAETLTALGNVRMKRHDPVGAKEYFQRALAIQKKLAPGSLAIARTLHRLGVLEADREPDKSVRYHREELAIRERLEPDSLQVARSLNSLGVAEKNLGDLADAEDCYGKALAIQQRIAPGGLDVAALLDNLSVIELEQGELTQAAENNQRALEIYEQKAASSLDRAMAVNNMGYIAEKRGDLDRAEEGYQLALHLAQNVEGGSDFRAHPLDNLGNVAFTRRDWMKAREYHLQASEIFRQQDSSSVDYAKNLHNLGLDAQAGGEIEAAEKYFEEALAIKRRITPEAAFQAITLNSLGEIAFQQGDMAKAQKYFQEGVRLQRKETPESPILASSLLGLGMVFHARGDRDASEKYARQAVAILEKSAPGTGDHAESLATLARYLREKDEGTAAAQFYARALDALEHQIARLGGKQDLRSDFRAQHANDYHEYISLLIEQHKDELAFQTVERLRAQGLLTMLAESQVDIRQGVDPELLVEERSVRDALGAKVGSKIRLLGGKHTERELAAVNKEIEKENAHYEDIERLIRSKSPEYASLTHPQPVGIDQVQRELLDEDTMLLEYVLGEKQSYLFAVTRASFASYVLPSRAEIERAALRAYELLTARDRPVANEDPFQRKDRVRRADAEFLEQARNLSGMVLGPVAGRLGKKRLLIVSDGALQYVPFGVLPAPSTGKSTASWVLMVRHEIISLPSASVLVELRRAASRHEPPPGQVAVLADPVFDGHDGRVGRGEGAVGARPDSDRLSRQSSDRLMRSIADVGWPASGLPRLPSTRREAETILSLAEPNRRMSALDFEASREAAISPELAKYGVVHFATHSLLDTKHPELSGLVLSMVDAQGHPRNGYLDLQDIYNLKLRAELVVLSACQTALGKEISEEGLIGLTRGFMYAGAARVIASLWKADDAATTELMSRFYRLMWKSRMRPAAALQQAQIQMSKEPDWASPYYWAGFQIQGDWK
jgi:CHAT domain-containing protein/tetratricopeptide (TPR) repeat protein